MKGVLYTGQSTGFMHRFGKVWKLHFITSVFGNVFGKMCKSSESEREKKKSLRSGKIIYCKRTRIITGLNVSLIMTLLPFYCRESVEIKLVLCCVKRFLRPSLISFSSRLSVGISFAEVISSFVPSLENSVVCITLCKMQYCEELEYFLCCQSV